MTLPGRGAGASRTSIAVLFDLDGVIVDSRAHHLTAWEALARAHELDVSAGYFDASFGLRNDAILGRLLPAANEAELQALADEKEAAFRASAGGALELLPGVGELITFLEAQHIQRAVVTSTPRENLTMILDDLGLADRFDALVSGEDVAHGKPDPEGFVVAARRLGVDATGCVVIEDAPAGLQAAKAAGMRAVGVTTTHLAPDLGDADLVVGSLAEEAVRMFILQ
jgi:beta-phosphoglucomutase family hydrolase